MNTETATQTPEKNYNVIRNGVTKKLSRQVFGKKSPNAGKDFYAPEVTEETLEQDTIWIGKDQVASSLSRNLRAIFAGIFIENIERNNGSFNEEQFLEEAADFTAARASLTEIEDQLDDLQALQQSYALSDKFGELDNDGNKTPEALELETKIKDTAMKIKPLRLKKQALEQDYAARAQKRKEAKEAKEAASKTAPETVEA